MLPENMKNKKIMIPAILCLAVLVFLVRRLPSKQPTAKQEDAARVQVARAIYSDSLKKGLHTTVSLKAISDVVIRPKVESHLQNLYVKKGQMFQHRNLSFYVIDSLPKNQGVVLFSFESLRFLVPDRPLYRRDRYFSSA